MHPPFQILANSPKFKFHPFSLILALNKLIPWAYVQIFKAYKAF